MAISFEYQVCQVQKSRVTFVNGKWQGNAPLDAEREEESLNSCPRVWEYLQQAGTEGWELVSTVTRFNAKDEAPSLVDLLISDESTVTKYAFYDTMYLKRTKS
jgi:hypothetical protein